MAEKLESLFQLQLIDTQIDKIQIMKGELPLEVKDLEDEIEGLNKRVHNLEAEMNEYKDAISNVKNSIIDINNLILKYKKQQGNVKNNREFDALAKEIEMQSLEIQLAERQIKDNPPSWKRITVRNLARFRYPQALALIF